MKYKSYLKRQLREQLDEWLEAHPTFFEFYEVDDGNYDDEGRGFESALLCWVFGDNYTEARWEVIEDYAKERLDSLNAASYQEYCDAVEAGEIVDINLNR